MEHKTVRNLVVALAISASINIYLFLLIKNDEIFKVILNDISEYSTAASMVDSLVNTKFDSMIEEGSAYSNVTYYKIYYSNYVINVSHHAHVEFESTEKWDFECVNKGGVTLLNTCFGSDNKLRPKTVDKIKAMCYDIAKFK